MVRQAEFEPATYGFVALLPGIAGTRRELKGLNHFNWLGPFLFIGTIRETQGE